MIYNFKTSLEMVKFSVSVIGLKLCKCKRENCCSENSLFIYLFVFVNGYYLSFPNIYLCCLLVEWRRLIFLKHMKGLWRMTILLSMNVVSMGKCSCTRYGYHWLYLCYAANFCTTINCLDRSFCSCPPSKWLMWSFC